MARKMDVEEYTGLIARGDIYNMARALARALPIHLQFIMLACRFSINLALFYSNSGVLA